MQPDPVPRADASHPLVAKVLAVTPRMNNGEVTLAYGDACDCSETCCGFIDRQGDPAPIAARQIGVVYRGIADHLDSQPTAPGKVRLVDAAWLRARADEIDPPEATP